MSLVRCWQSTWLWGPVAAGICWLPTWVAAQGTVPARADSADVVSTACALLLALRPVSERYHCEVVTYQETSTEFVVQLHEQPPSGAPPLVFDRSVVRLSKAERWVTISRVPEQ